MAGRRLVEDQEHHGSARRNGARASRLLRVWVLRCDATNALQPSWKPSLPVASDTAERVEAYELGRKALEIYEELGVRFTETVRAAMCQLDG